MCGIVGSLAFRDSGFTVTEPYVTRLREQVAHRGPDGAATWVSEDARVGLGFRRLAIIDLSDAAMQPMANEDGSIRVLCNGEIYNHAEIRAELERLGGHSWRTDHSDTEVIVHAFEEWGIECLERFRGMFAIAIWDGRERALWLVRDRLGVKPLYYSVHHRRLVFGSEIKALLADPEQKREVDEESFYHQLSFHLVPAPRTVFRGIRKLRPGTWLRVEETGRLEEKRYWDVWEHVEPLHGISEDDAAERLLEELRTAVRLRKVSDVPVGVFLSGGLDSSTNAVLFSEGEEAPVKTFSIGWDRDYPSYPSELEYARLVADRAGAEYHERRLSVDDMLTFLSPMARLNDEPVSNPAYVPTHYVSALARENGVIVAQVGEGSDELFIGYPNYAGRLRVQRADDLPVPRLLKRLAAAAAPHVGVSSRKAEHLRRGGAGLPIFWSGREAFTDAEKRRLLSPRLRRELAGLSSWDAAAPFRRHFEQHAWEQSHVNWVTYSDMNMRLPESLLMRVDKMSMSVGLEARTPFLDHKFVELVLSLPTAVKVPNGTLKHILKRAVANVIPGELLRRQKQGFAVPGEWYESLRTVAYSEVDRFCAETDLLDRDAAQQFVSEGRTRMWGLLSLALWYRELF
jgi:asparagine synthase (glutamine-hydrolysing)